MKTETEIVIYLTKVHRVVFLKTEISVQKKAAYFNSKKEIHKPETDTKEKFDKSVKGIRVVYTDIKENTSDNEFRN